MKSKINHEDYAIRIYKRLLDLSPVAQVTKFQFNGKVPRKRKICGCDNNSVVMGMRVGNPRNVKPSRKLDSVR